MFKHKRALESNKAVKAQPHHVASFHSLESDLTANQSHVLAMQHTQGNRAVLRMFARSQAAAQRAPQIGWNQQDGTPTTGPNKDETKVPMDSAHPELGKSRRIPVSGLNFGSGHDDKSGVDWQGHTASNVTKETAKDKQAIVVIPDNLDVAHPVGILLHLQGLTVGYRNQGGQVEDVDFARIEQQLRASERNMIAILPQAALPDSLPGKPDFGNVTRDSDNLCKDVFDFLTDKKLWTVNPSADAKPVRPVRGPLVYSAYSGGGFSATSELKKDITGESAKKGDINPAKMAGVILFDSIHNDDQVEQVKDWLNAQMNHDLEQLSAIAKKTTDPTQREEREKEQLQYLTTSMRFRGIYSHTSKDYYAKNYVKVKAAIEKWFTDHEGALAKITTAEDKKDKDVVTNLKANYQVIDTGHSDHATVISQGDPLKNALIDMPAIGSTTANQPSGASQPAANQNTQQTQTPNTQRMAQLQRQPAPNPQGNTGATNQSAATPEQMLIDAAVDLAQSGATRLQPDYIRNRLQTRSGDAALSTEFSLLLAQITLQDMLPFGSLSAVVIAAQGLIKFLEQQFINDPHASTLDLLARGQSYRNRRWDNLDYPGHAEREKEGPHEAEATQMMADLAGIEGERRPNKGTTAVVQEDEFTSNERLQTYIVKQLRTVPDLPAEPGKRSRAVSQSDQKLNDKALTDFLRMRQDADNDGVDLIILNGYRTPATSKANSAGQNPNAIASYSSHNLGLAMDLQMSHGRQQFVEATTRPMQNVVDMHQAPAHKWMFLHGPDYGWFPWHFEPWHWEYNPDGFRDRFQADFQRWQVDNPPPNRRR
ncbi:MAG: D-alanyl-D-alanine carboxypeptidase family protein [Aggregatilineales bacterium]